MMMSIFEKHGTVESVRVIRDHDTQQPRGYGFVKFSKPEEAANAIENCNGMRILNKRLKVAYSRPGGSRANANLFIGCIPDDWDESGLKRAFDKYKPVIDCRILRFDSGESKGCGFIRLDSSSLARQAILEMDGKLIGKCNLQVKLATGRMNRSNHGSPNKEYISPYRGSLKPRGRRFRSGRQYSGGYRAKDTDRSQKPRFSPQNNLQTNKDQQDMANMDDFAGPYQPYTNPNLNPQQSNFENEKYTNQYDTNSQNQYVPNPYGNYQTASPLYSYPSQMYYQSPAPSISAIPNYLQEIGRLNYSYSSQSPYPASLTPASLPQQPNQLYTNVNMQQQISPIIQGISAQTLSPLLPVQVSPLQIPQVYTPTIPALVLSQQAPSPNQSQTILSLIGSPYVQQNQIPALDLRASDNYVQRDVDNINKQLMSMSFGHNQAVTLPEQASTHKLCR